MLARKIYSSSDSWPIRIEASRSGCDARVDCGESKEEEGGARRDLVLDAKPVLIVEYSQADGDERGEGSDGRRVDSKHGWKRTAASYQTRQAEKLIRHFFAREN